MNLVSVINLKGLHLVIDAFDRSEESRILLKKSTPNSIFTAVIVLYSKYGKAVQFEIWSS